MACLALWRQRAPSASFMERDPMTPVTKPSQIRDAAFSGQCLLVHGVLYPAKAIYHRRSLAEVCSLIVAGAVLAFDRRGDASC
jgi:hypothetical protein